MKYAIMSDAHSNPVALELALKDAKKRKCGRFVFLGDTTGYGYDVKATLELVRENFDEVIMGNHDAICCGAENDECSRLNPHYDIDRSQGRILERKDIDWLRSLKYTYENEDFICAHGDFVDPASWGYIIEPDEAYGSFAKCSRDLMFCGHTHHICVWECAGREIGNRFENRFLEPATAFETIAFKLKEGVRYIVNVGSVGYPRHDLCCSYAIYDSDAKRVTIRRLPFDFRGYILAMIAAKIELPQWLNELLMIAAGRRGK